VTKAARPWPAQVAVTMFTIIPAPLPARVDEDLASRAVLWLPAVGVLLSVPAAGALLCIDQDGSAPLRRLLGAAVAVTVLGVLTGGLHLDGLADTADGLASRRGRDAVLEIMRRGDTGPTGVAALVLTVLLQVTALAALPGHVAVTGLVLGAVTARTAVILATGPAFPPARPDGFGALVAGRTSARACAAAMIALPVAVAAVAEVGEGSALTARLLAATLVGLLAATAVCRAARSCLGGLTGDVFGAVIEVTMTVTLVALTVLT
jgi:adenosylcobinamide-GDP ribazoletransferase